MHGLELDQGAQDLIALALELSEAFGADGPCFVRHHARAPDRGWRRELCGVPGGLVRAPGPAACGTGRGRVVADAVLQPAWWGPRRVNQHTLFQRRQRSLAAIDELIEQSKPADGNFDTSHVHDAQTRGKPIAFRMRAT